MAWLQSLALLFGAAASAAAVSESITRGAEKRAHKAKLKRGMILPAEAARELEHRIGGRVAVGMDDHPKEPYKLVIMRLRPGTTFPKEFAGYRVELQPKITIHS